MQLGTNSELKARSLINLAQCLDVSMHLLLYFRAGKIKRGKKEAAFLSLQPDCAMPTGLAVWLLALMC